MFPFYVKLNCFSVKHLMRLAFYQVFICLSNRKPEKLIIHIDCQDTSHVQMDFFLVTLLLFFTSDTPKMLLSLY